MAEAERLCARIGFLARGKLVAEGTADELKEKAGVESLDDAFIKLTGEELKNEDEQAAASELEKV
jgi:ABC-2 type transport system ATP-binding protein